MVAIIPAAGRGSRMLEHTGGKPKEMLLVRGKSVVEWAIDEAGSSGATRIVVVSSPLKQELNRFVADLGSRVGLVYQEEPLGLAHAISCAEIHGEPSLILMGDSVYFPSSPLRRIAVALEKGAWAAVAVRKVAHDQVSLYGIVEFEKASHAFHSIIEKPSSGEAKSNWAVSGRYGLSAEAMALLTEKVGAWKEQDESTLTSILQLGLSRGHRIQAVPIESGETLYDCGDWQGYRRAQEEIGA